MIDFTSDPFGEIDPQFKELLYQVKKSMPDSIKKEVDQFNKEIEDVLRRR